MSTSTFSVRMDEKLKNQFDALCSDFGMNMSVAINIFARAVVRERKIPFEIGCAKTSGIADSFAALRKEAVSNNIAGMSLDEINAEIQAVRCNK